MPGVGDAAITPAFGSCYAPLTSDDRRKLPASERSRATELSESHFRVEERDSDEDEHDGVRNEERAAAVTIAQVREPPHVAQTNSVPGQ